MEVENTYQKDREESVEASWQEADLGFAELGGGDETLEGQSHLYFSLHLCQCASVVPNSIPERNNLIGSAQPRWGRGLGVRLSWASVHLLVSRRGARSRVVPHGVGPSRPSPRLPHVLRGRVVLNPACAQRCISPEQGMPGSYEVILEGSTFHHFFRLKGMPFLIDPPRGRMLFIVCTVRWRLSSLQGQPQRLWN